MITECDIKHCEIGKCWNWKDCPNETKERIHSMFMIPDLKAENVVLKARIATFETIKKPISPVVVVPVVEMKKPGRPRGK